MRSRDAVDAGSIITLGPAVICILICYIQIKSICFRIKCYLGLLSTVKAEFSFFVGKMQCFKYFKFNPSAYLSSCNMLFFREINFLGGL